MFRSFAIGGVVIAVLITGWSMKNGHVAAAKLNYVLPYLTEPNVPDECYQSIPGYGWRRPPKK